MLTLAAHLRIYAHTGPADLRKSFDGLCGLVRSVFQADPLDGSLFLFHNRRGDRVKILYWDRDGLALWYKRLERGTFEMIPAREGEAVVEIDATQLAMLLGGVPLASGRRKRYSAVG
jgi:transposase